MLHLEVPNAPEDGNFVSSPEIRQEDAAHPADGSQQINTDLSSPANAAGASKSSREDGEDVIYTTVIWKSKNKKKEDEDLEEEEESVAGGVSRNLEEGNLYEKVGIRNMRKKVECEYAQVKFKDQTPTDTE